MSEDDVDAGMKMVNVVTDRERVSGADWGAAARCGTVVVLLAGRLPIQHWGMP